MSAHQLSECLSTLLLVEDVVKHVAVFVEYLLEELMRHLGRVPSPEYRFHRHAVLDRHGVDLISKFVQNILPKFIPFSF